MGCSPASANVMSHAAAPLLAVLLLLGSGRAATLRTARADRDGGAAATRHAANGALRGSLGLNGDESAEDLDRILGEFQEFASVRRNELDEAATKEQKGLEAALSATGNQATQFALTHSMTVADLDFRETRKVYSAILKFVDNFKHVLKEVNYNGETCADIACGPHAVCTMTSLGTQCVCNEGYVGNGQDCHAPEAFLPKRLLSEGVGGLSAKVSDLHVALLGEDRVITAWRDETHKNIGRMMIGEMLGSGMISWTAPTQFSPKLGKAYDPVAVPTSQKTFVVAWRDEDRKGACVMRSGVTDTTGIRGAEDHVVWAHTVHFCQNQGHRFSMVSLPPNRLAVFYSDRANVEGDQVAESFGNSVLAQVSPTGVIDVLGNWRFAEVPVVRIQVTMMTPTQFVLAARGAQSEDEPDPTKAPRQEAMTIFGQMSDDDLVFDPNVLNLEPTETEVWGRGVGLLAPNTVGYAYYLGKRQETKLAAIHVDPVTHQMKVLSSTILRKGETPYVSMLSLPYTVSDPHSFVYYQSGHESAVNLCTLKGGTALQGCEEFTWLQQSASSVHAVRLGAGRALFVFSTPKGVPYYSVVGIAKKF